MTLAALLFLGFPIDDLLAQKLNSVAPIILQSFISEGDHYLKEIMDQGTRYLGKYVPSCIEVSELDHVEANIYSLLKKIEPNYPFHQQPLVLLATF